MEWYGDGLGPRDRVRSGRTCLRTEDRHGLADRGGLDAPPNTTPGATGREVIGDGVCRIVLLARGVFLLAFGAYMGWSGGALLLGG